MGLRRTLNRTGSRVRDLTRDVQGLPVNVDVSPLQRGQFTALAPVTAANRKKIGRLRLTECAASISWTTSPALGR